MGVSGEAARLDLRRDGLPVFEERRLPGRSC